MTAAQSPALATALAYYHAWPRQLSRGSTRGRAANHRRIVSKDVKLALEVEAAKPAEVAAPA